MIKQFLSKKNVMIYQVIGKKDDVVPLLDRIVSISNKEIQEGDFNLPDNIKRVVKSVFFKRVDNYLVVFLPYELSGFTSNIVDYMFGITRKLKDIFKQAGLDVQIKRLK